MLIKIKRGWELPESAATPEAVFHDRRRFLKAVAAGPILAVAPSLLAACEEGPNQSAEAAVQMAAAGEPDPSAKLYPVMRNLRYRLDRDITDEELATTYNNYYEFGSSKNIWKKAQALPLRPWTVKIAGQVEKPFEIGIDDLLAKMPLEERLYRHRCVEAWSMAVPWTSVCCRRSTMTRSLTTSSSPRPRRSGSGAATMPSVLGPNRRTRSGSRTRVTITCSAVASRICRSRVKVQFST